jgi:hypothetical protein
MEIQKQLADEYAALAQVYRWLQVYDMEQNPTHLQNMLSILRDDFILYTYDGTIRGKDNYLIRLNIQRSWQHANHVKQTAFSLDKLGSLYIELETNYQNILPGNLFNSYLVKYQIKLIPTKNTLPLISEIRLIPISFSEEKRLVETYKDNRSKSFIYFLLHCFETYKVNPEKGNDIFNQDFFIQHNNGAPFNSKEEVINWIRRSASRHVGCYPTPKNIKVAEINKDKANVSFDIFWISFETLETVSLTNCSCLIQYNQNGYFANLEAMHVSSTIIEKHQPTLMEA